MMITKTRFLAAVLTATTMSAAHAVPTLSISGEGQSAADAAETAFLNGLQPGYVTDDFENYAVATDSSGQTATFNSAGGSLEAVTNGSGGLCDNSGFSCGAGLAVLNQNETPFSGRFATSSDQWLDSMDATNVDFRPQAGTSAIGFFMTDPNDSGGRFAINGQGFDFDDIFGSALGNGSVFYISLIDTAGINSFNILSNAPSDGYGLDDVTVGTAQVPEPGTLSLLGLGLVALGVRARRRR